MKVLIAEDDRVSLCVLQATLEKHGHEVVAAADGREAWEVLQRPDAPRLAILDWMMPELDGTEICRRVRALDCPEPPYLILLTARVRKEDVVTGLESGADDYVTKPFDRQELLSRIRVGERVLGLQASLAGRVRDLEVALAHVKHLHGLLPICCYCKKVRDDQNYWHEVERYVADHADVSFSHGICPTCWQDVVAPQLERTTGTAPPS
jgi:sigma-B regulation protein RsbU (phosphoserine phosphatase)